MDVTTVLMVLAKVAVWYWIIKHNPVIWGKKKEEK